MVDACGMDRSGSEVNAVASVSDHLTTALAAGVTVTNDACCSSGDENPGRLTHATPPAPESIATPGVEFVAVRGQGVHKHARLLLEEPP